MAKKIINTTTPAQSGADMAETRALLLKAQAAKEKERIQAAKAQAVADRAAAKLRDEQAKVETVATSHKATVALKKIEDRLDLAEADKFKALCQWLITCAPMLNSKLRILAIKADLAEVFKTTPHKVAKYSTAITHSASILYGYTDSQKVEHPPQGMTALQSAIDASTSSVTLYKALAALMGRSRKNAAPSHSTDVAIGKDKAKPSMLALPDGAKDAQDAAIRLLSQFSTLHLNPISEGALIKECATLIEHLQARKVA